MTAVELPLPTFLIIGAQKSATRWLRVNLGEHPDVFTASLELSFWNHGKRVRQQGLRWYRAQFKGWNGEPIVGEATPGYMMWRHKPPVVAKRIHDVLPDVRLLAVLRNPVDRARSAMIHHISRERLPASSDLLEVVRREPPETDWLGVVNGGWYAASLAPYVRLFKDQLLVVLHDDIQRDPVGVYEAALRHVGADTGFVPEGLREVRFSNVPRVKSAPVDLTLDDRRELYAYFRDDVRQLEQLIGRDLSMWDPEASEQVAPDAASDRQGETQAV